MARRAIGWPEISDYIGTHCFSRTRKLEVEQYYYPFLRMDVKRSLLRRESRLLSRWPLAWLNLRP
jgi:hypothetical protein